MYKVCFADDEPIMFKVLEALVDWEGIGYRIAGIATDGIEALELYEKEKPDFMIIDIKMPVMDGLQCVQHIREKDANIKIVLLTASDSFASAQEALNLNANGYLLKPVSREALNKMVAKITKTISSERNASAAFCDSSAQLLQKQLRRLYMASVSAGEGVLFPPEIGLLLEKDYTILDAIVCSPQQSAEDSKALEALHDFLIRPELALLAFDIPVSNRVLYLLRPLTGAFPSLMEAFFVSQATVPTFSVYIQQSGTRSEDLRTIGDSLHANMAHAFYNTRHRFGTFILQPPALHIPLSIAEIKHVISAGLLALSITPVSDFLASIFQMAKETLCCPRCLQSFCYDIILQLRQSLRELSLCEDSLSPRHIGIEHFLSTGSADALRMYTIDMFANQLEVLSHNESFAKNKAFILRANIFAQKHFTDSAFSLDAAADFVGLSKNYFIRLYGKETDMGFWTYITKLRIERAKLLLSSTKLSVLAICLQTGYDDVSYFSKKFKTETGMTPKEYRAIHLGHK